MYNDSREERVKIFEETKCLYTMDNRLVDSISFSKQNQRVIPEELDFPASSTQYDEPAKVLVSQRKSLEAARRYSNQKVCVLNFASATNPGGGVEKGSNAQEEAICRCSTLFPCISDSKVVSQFHDKHRKALKAGQLNALYNDDCIYTPNVIVFRSDTGNQSLLQEKDWFGVDILSCAAPNLRSKPSNAMNPNSGDKAVSIKPSELLELHKKRISKILSVAKENGAEVVILGAFGCGAFQNSPDIVARAMHFAVNGYRHSFKTIEFAVYCSPKETKNYDIFKRTLSSLCK